MRMSPIVLFPFLYFYFSFSFFPVWIVFRFQSLDLFTIDFLCTYVLSYGLNLRFRVRSFLSQMNLKLTNHGFWFRVICYFHPLSESGFSIEC